MLIYLLFPLIIVGFSFLATKFIKNKKISDLVCSLVPALLLFVLLGFKGINVGADSKTYYNAYNDIATMAKFPNPQFFTDLNRFNFKSEYGFILMAQLFSSLGLPYLVLQVFLYGIICFCLFFSIWKTSLNKMFSFFIFYTFTFFTFFVSGLRQAFATSLCLLAISLILDKGRTSLTTILYFLLVAIATLWHKSALIFILPYFITNIKIKTNAFFILLFVSVLFHIFGAEMYEVIIAVSSEIFDSKSSDYAPFSFGKGISAILLLCIIVFSYIIANDSLIKLHNLPIFERNERIRNIDLSCYDNLDSNKNIPFFVLMTFIGVWLMYTNSYSIAFGRIAMYFSIFVIYLLPNSIERLRNKKIKTILVYGLLIAFYGYFIYTSILPNYLAIGPYTFIEGTI